jgi:pimeloyl-ACP methyl ester carboxylesterase
MSTGRTRTIVQLPLIVLVASGLYGQTPAEQVVTEFEGHQVTLMKPGLDANDLAEETARVCFDVTSTPQCYSPQHEPGSGWGPDQPIGTFPELMPMNLGGGRSALLFTVVARSYGSGATVHYALLRPGRLGSIENLLPPDLVLSEISEQDFWSDPSISDAPLLVTADFVWNGISEGHFSDHRFTVSAYTLAEDPNIPGRFNYVLEDRYLTARKYQIASPDASDHVLDAERPEILARLKRVKVEREAEAARQAKSPG